MGFLDNLSKTLSSGVDRAKFEAEKLQRTNRLRGELTDLQQQVDTNLRQLGERALELHSRGEIQAPEIASLAQMIEQLRQQLSAKQQELTAAQNEAFQEGHPQQPQQQYQQQVPQAHGDQGQAQPAQPAATIACPTCQATLPASAAFCGNCGSRIGS